MWTIIDGQLIARSTVTYVANTEPEVNVIPKPPRLPIEQLSNKSSTEEIQEKELNIQVTCINESKLMAKKEPILSKKEPSLPKLVKNRAKSLTNLKKDSKFILISK